MNSSSDSSEYQLTVEDAPRPEDIELLDERLTAFVVTATGHDDARPLAVLARTPRGGIVGGIHGWTWGGVCELISLWVSDDARGRGIGAELMQSAETEALARGCTQVVLFTHDTQTPERYLRAGYEQVGVVDDYPTGGAAYWLRKRL